MAIREKYINPFTDFGFKKLFGTEFNKDLLIDFLNQVLSGKEQIRDLTYLNPENQGKLERDRKAIFDVYCENERGERFIIEVQNVRQDFFKDRSIFYATFPIQEQVEKGKDWDYALKTVYTIGILNFTFPDKSMQERYIREIQLIDTHTFEVFYDKLSFIYLEMPRFRKNEAELETHFDKWMYVLKNLQRLKKIPAKLREQIFEKLFKQAEIVNLTQEEMNAYEESLKVYRDNYSVLKSASEEGKRKGMELGIKKGLKEGASKRELEIAKKLKEKGVPIEMIAETTGLRKEQIEKL
ncbi:PD-(D/E)XK nuclease family transposase [Rhodocytophaga rosea]|uniref:PD-(D/E)XK nuclease family transposase n=1 Tax=Rhodocytophaga rosea TaxID=2704465 RepID=A0A6C0GPM8_9BACT|nr:Rpn family recombination-promoting nuclease/putative transposase [Rhodocytophaga rosea]QHT70008.1 PD-(D/E)XK nuclease family transposase [Rhodocytophaga rosea]